MRDIPKLWHVTMGKAGESYDKPSNFGLHKRSCCSTWFRRKFDMNFAEELRKILFIREEWPFPDKGILINHHIYIHIHWVSMADEASKGSTVAEPAT